MKKVKEEKYNAADILQCCASNGLYTDEAATLLGCSRSLVSRAKDAFMMELLCPSVPQNRSTPELYAGAEARLRSKV